jgi:hypothetical protein
VNRWVPGWERLSAPQRLLVGGTVLVALCLLAQAIAAKDAEGVGQAAAVTVIAGVMLLTARWVGPSR